MTGAEHFLVFIHSTGVRRFNHWRRGGGLAVPDWSEVMSEGSRPSAIVVPDANAIVFTAWRLDTPPWTVLLHLSRSGAIQLVVSELTIEEVVGVFQRTLLKHLNSAVSENEKAAALLSTSLQSPALDVRTEADRYRGHLVGLLSAAGANIVQLPAVDLMALAQRAVARVRPFDEHGSGFRDALIWLTLLEQGKDERGAEVHLISKDTSAFRSGKGVSAFHTTLLAEARTAGLSTDPRLHESVLAYIDTLGPLSADQTFNVVAALEKHEPMLSDAVVSNLVGLELLSADFVATSATVDAVIAGPFHFERAAATDADSEVALLHLAVDLHLSLSIWASPRRADGGYDAFW